MRVRQEVSAREEKARKEKAREMKKCERERMQESLRAMLCISVLSLHMTATNMIAFLRRGRKRHTDRPMDRHDPALRC